MIEIKGEKGSVILIVTLMMTVLLGFIALVADLGLLFLEKNRLSNAVDAAALAGVQELPFDIAASISVAGDYLNRNMKGLQDSQVTISKDNKEIQVVAKKNLQFAFGPLFGVSSKEIEATARARIDVVTAISGVVPLAVVRQNFVFGKQYMLKLGAGQGEGQYHGNFGALALGGKGASVYRQNLAEGYSGVLRIGDWVLTEPGNMAGPTVQGVRDRLEACPNSTYDNFPKNCERLVIVPIVESLEVHGRKDVKISGFAAFFLESTSKRGNNSNIVGRFIRYAAQGEIGSGEDFGLKAAKLIQ